MKKALSLAIVLALVLVPLGLMASPPESIEASFDSETGMLAVKIGHRSLGVDKHYIKEIKVSINGEEALVATYKAQTSKAGLDVSFSLPDAKSGDEIEVYAKCNIRGDMKTAIKVE